MASFLRDRRVQEASVIAVQEPWKNTLSNTTHQPISSLFQLVYPSTSLDEPPGVCFYISKNLHPGEWSCTLVDRDYQILKLRKAHAHGNWTDLFVHNIYNRQGTGIPDKLRQELSKRKEAEHIVVGDFNAHHPVWGGPGAPAEAESEDFLLLADQHKLDLLTEAARPTWERGGAESVIDLTWISEELTGRLVNHGRADDIEHQSDHYPVRTTLDVQTPLFKAPERRNWSAMDDKILTEFIEKHVISRDLTSASQQRVELETQTFIRTIQVAIDASTPWAKPSMWSNSDFTLECREAVKTVRFLRRQWTRSHDPLDELRYKQARNDKNRLIKGTLSKAHRKRVQKVMEEGPRGMWRLAKWARNHSGVYERGLTPTLRARDGSTAETMEQKAAAFQHAFFPQPPEADITDTEGYIYPESVDFPEITHHEIQEAIRATPAGKAPREDAIPNALWHKLIKIPVVASTLHQLFNACVRIGYNPGHFQRSITVMLRKAGDRDYQEAKSYRPVALLNTIAKFLESIITRRISYAMEEHGLLPKGHLSGRRGISTEHAIQIMLDRIRSAWGRGSMVSLLMLDISRAYNNVSHARLIHNIKKRRLSQLTP
ncbi:reverse transcriptase [Penicillium pulvis]|uniref:reverse transcriptase n=1 Tax=Penicillium pulvis TaxID=1562058 RepID=UPI002547F29D|nr:reverse transcriptase [Penicillium pulvis]KAJ5809036.1 reverse transcriptase [Penicillium pulvis]